MRSLTLIVGMATASVPAAQQAAFEAVSLQEQLGLKLESTKGSVDLLVIDSISRPTPD